MLKQSSPEAKANRVEEVRDTAPLPQNTASAPDAKRSPIDLYTDDLIEKLDRLYDELRDSPHRVAFVDALTWRLAKIAFTCGPYAAGDIVRQYGRHLANIASHDSARREAEAAKAAGRLPQ